MSYIVGLLSPGDMGSAVGARIVGRGARVFTCLEGRSERTKRLAEAAGLESAASLEDLVERCDLIISIMVPSEALGAAQSVAEAVKSVGKALPYTDCNAIAPSTAQQIGAAIVDAGGVAIDAGIIGGPPRGETPNTRFYASGPDASAFDQLNSYGMDVRVIGEEIGQASGLKMCYAASTKGTAALMLELLIAAKRLNLYDALIDEFGLSQQARLKSLDELNGVPSKSRRWIGEMEEIAKTFDEVGLTPHTFAGAADMFRHVGGNALADETPENRNRDRTVEELIRRLAH
ncbi:MAG: 6-phosphogluconate dehydrogenase [Gemmatimonadetes bacterium]|nr:6-phosphogluconate dehydrogenase [Gemmatimonadota bacterium]MBS14566.1 6-phosphogluconate dehydrogenase [Gemmatimonadota bacterium]